MRVLQKPVSQFFCPRQQMKTMGYGAYLLLALAPLNINVLPDRGRTHPSNTYSFNVIAPPLDVFQSYHNRALNECDSEE